MKASPCHGFLPIPKFVVFLILAISCHSYAQNQDDSLTLNNGQRREGQIMGVTGGNVQLQITAAGAGKVQSSVPLKDVKSASMTPPPAFDQAAADMAKGAAKDAATKLQPLVDSYLGLPASWVKTAAILLVDAQIESENQEGAEKTLVDFEKAYPESGNLTPLLKAKLAISRNNFVGAKPLLLPIVQQAEQTKLASAEQSVTFGQAFYLMGQIREAEGNYPEALQDYIRTSAIFFEDSATAAKAQERADRLREERNVTVP